MTRSEQWRLVLKLSGGLAPVAALVGLIPGFFLGDGSIPAMLSGGLIGFLIGTGMVFFQVSWGVGLIPRQVREAPFLTVLLTKSLAWLVIIVLGLSIPLLTIGNVPFEDLAAPSFIVSIIVSFGIAATINFGFQVNQLMGRGVLIGLIAGRYHRPREEDRIFLFIDLRGSTTLAESLGNIRYHALLRRFIADITPPVIRNGGDIHRYVGDQIILSWRSSRGIKNAACVRAYFGMLDEIEQSQNQYQREFGIVPSFWAGLHRGPVVAGEIGTAKHEIVYLGDTMNVSARIEQNCRTLERPCLASADLIRSLTLPDGVVAEDLGKVDLRGVGAPVALFALSRER